MQKFTTAIVVCLVVLAFGATGMASKGNVEFGGGLTFNTLNMITVKDGEIQELEPSLADLKHGSGYFGRVDLWITKWLGIQIGHEGIRTLDVNVNPIIGETRTSGELSGWSLGMATRFSNLKLSGALGNYTYIQKSEVGSFAFNSEYVGPGVLLGVEFDIPLAENLNITASANVRGLRVSTKNPQNQSQQVDPQNYLDLSGARLGLGANLIF